MAEIQVSLVQTKDVIYTARQGNALTIPITWEQETEDSTPTNPQFELIDISDFSFFAQIRIGTADANGKMVFEFPETPDDDGNHYDVDIDEATVTYYLSDELMRSLKDKHTYYLESKMRDADGNNIESVVITFKIKEEYSREIPAEE